MDKLSEQYLKGFNYAYLLAEYNPRLIEKIIKITNSNDYILGLKDGEKAFKKTKVKSRFQELKNIHLRKNRGYNKDFEI